MTLPTSPNIHQVPPPSLAELSRRATVDKTDLSKYSIRSWIAAVNKLYEQVRVAIYAKILLKFSLC
jgi:hypothetical protein